MLSNSVSVIFLPFVSGRNQHAIIAVSGASVKMSGGSHAASEARPAANGARAEPTLETVEDAPIAIVRATVGNNSDVYVYLETNIGM